jgi:aldehyde dehydrogenase (NAD+)
MYRRDELYIGGEWVAPAGARTLQPTVNCTTEEILGHALLGGERDVERAAAAARAAWEPWSSRSPKERATYLHEIARQLEADFDELCEICCTEVGTPIAQARSYQKLAISIFDYYADLAGDFDWTHDVATATIAREPIGVVAAITAWNFPLLLMALKVAPALAAGCSVVLKPAEIAPLAGFMLADSVHRAGLPGGVFNMVTGTGADVGSALVRHSEIDMVSFTGSTRAGRQIGAEAAQSIKRVSLELGGKSALIVLDEDSIPDAVAAAMESIMTNNGQGCGCLSRVLVPQAQLGEVEARIADYLQRVKIGDPLDEMVTLGPMASAEHQQRVSAYIREADAAGIRRIDGGRADAKELRRGFFVPPVAFVAADPKARIAQEEVFGPVQVVIPYAREEDAVSIANSTIYGLAGSVYGADPQRARKVAGALRCGKVTINCARFDPATPFGGYKQSGIGRAYGVIGFEEYLETKSILEPV